MIRKGRPRQGGETVEERGSAREESSKLTKTLATITGKMYRKSDGALLALCEVRLPSPSSSFPAGAVVR